MTKSSIQHELARFTAGHAETFTDERNTQRRPVVVLDMEATSATVDRLIFVLAIAAGAVLRLWQINATGFNTDEAVYSGQAAGIVGDPTLKPYFPVFRAHPLLSQFMVALLFRYTGTSDVVAR